MSKENRQEKQIEQAIKRGANDAKSFILHELRNILSSEEQLMLRANATKDEKTEQKQLCFCCQTAYIIFKIKQLSF